MDASDVVKADAGPEAVGSSEKSGEWCGTKGCDRSLLE